MPWLPIYADETDLRLLHQWLNGCEELAFIVADGRRRWRAVSTVDRLEGRRICLWHVPSGPLPLVRSRLNEADDIVGDAWAGWKEPVAGADPSQPYFGAGHPAVFWLNSHPTPSRDGKMIGMSSFEWIGNHYKSVGRAATPEAERFWKELRRWVAQQSVKIPRTGPVAGSVVRAGAEIFAFPSALAAIRGGQARDDNPSF